MEDKSFDALVEQFLGKRPPPQMAEAISFPGLRPDAQDFIMRMLSLMKRSGHSAAELTPAFIVLNSKSIAKRMGRTDSSADSAGSP